MEPLSRDEVGAALGIVADDLERIESILMDASGAAVEFLAEVTTYLSKAGGKRLRPALLALASRLGTGPRWDTDATAAAIEMTHLATLYHDDVIDDADLRRGVPSANEKWGNTVAILAGDYLFARSSSLAADVGGEVPRVLADAIALVVQGQVRELDATYDTGRTAEHYFATIADKTAALIEASTRLGASLAGCPPELVELLRRFGNAFGFAFQIADDLLDLVATEDDLGKPPGTDLRDGVYTLPVILAIKAEDGLAATLSGPELDVDAVRESVVRTGAFAEALDAARQHAARALAILKGAPDGPAKESLVRLTRLIVDRVPVPDWERPA